MRELQRKGWISDQHGAWTMMALPPLLGWALSLTFVWMVVLMLVAWAMAFQMFSAVCLWVKTPAKRRGRIVPAILTYSVLAAIPGITLLAMRPQLLWWAIVFAPLASSALFLVWKGRERSLGARAASILAGGIMGPVAFALATADGSPAAVDPARVGSVHGVHAALCWHGAAGALDDPWPQGPALGDGGGTVSRLLHARRDRSVVVRRAIDLARPRVGVPDGARVGDADAEPHPKASPLPQVDRLHRDRLVGSAVRGAADPITASACRVGVSD